MKKFQSIALVIVALAVVAAGSAWFIRTKTVNQDKAEMASILTSLGNEIQDFHSNVAKISPSLVGKTALQNGVTQMKLEAESSIEKLTEVQRQADKSDSIYSISVRDAVERGIKYVTACQKMCNLKITVNTLDTASKEFFDSFDKAKADLIVTGSPTRSDSSSATDNIYKLATNFAAASKPKPAPVVQSSGSYYPGWVNTASDRRVYSGIADIAQQIQESRRFLGGRSGIDWSQGKAGNRDYFSQSWIRTILNDVIQQKRAQLNTVAMIARQEGTSELTNIVTEMLQNTIYGLGALHDNSDYATFKSYNNRNDILAATLANRYGIRAMGSVNDPGGTGR